MRRAIWMAVAAAATSLVSVAILFSSGRALADIAHVRVKGSARIDAHAARASGKLVLSGTVVDDTAHPIVGARVALGIARARSPAGMATLTGDSPEPCSEGAQPPILERGDLLSLPTDDAARFCARLTLPTDRYVVHLESLATGLVDGAHLDLPVDLALEPVTLRFDPERPVLSLDDESALLEVVASTEDDGVTTAAVGIPLLLANETGTPLGSAITNASGRARFAVDPTHLGPPGKGTLRVSFAGSNDAGASTHEREVERRTHVDLGAPDGIDGKLPVGSPEDGVVVRMRATARCAVRGCAGTPTGTVEARLGGDTIVGAAPLDNGEARVVLTFAMPAASEAALRLRYVPDAPWYQPGPELALTLPLRAPSPWKKLPLLLAGLGVLAWLAVARLPPRAPGRRTAAPRDPAHHPEAGVELLRAGPAARGWTGRIHDAHDGFRLTQARVAVERPAFEGVEVLAEVLSDTEGSFVIPPVELRPGDQLLAEGPLHGMLRRPMPPPGELDVALVLRKRALIDRLVNWARRRGKPFDSRPEPTPGHVRRAAAADLAVARWADAVEEAAYGGGVVDAEAERRVDELAPGDGPGRAPAAIPAVPVPGVGPGQHHRPGPR